MDRLVCRDVKGSVIKISRAENIATTPPSLLGIDRRMAYAHKKYHSGLMWTGVTIGLAGIKFSGSVSRLGMNSAINQRKDITNTKPTKSLEL